ncbi:MAG: hypothetical protein DI570_20795 [Phenylobacterium zucineum]|nr:MAG: hypothetical protein DI570_20795 [Phenylobacterium zucineum]
MALAAIGAVVLLALAGGAALLTRSVWRDEASDAAAEQTASREEMAEARAALEDRFPNAAQMAFSGVFAHGEDAGRAVCGSVDIEQPDDGFDGPERFVFVDGGLTVEEADGTDAVTARWKDVCEG